MRSATVRAGLGLALAGVLVAAGSAGAAGRLARLPGDHVFPQGEGSPGPVTFRHASHVEEGRPDCLACHPRRFRILERGRLATGDPIRHRQMEAGDGCGSCHGKGAFGFESCEACHRT